MAEKIKIFNMTLIKVGITEPLTAPDQAVRNAAVLSSFYDDSRDAAMASHPWNFCSSRRELLASATAPLFEFGYAYDLPSDPYCLRVWEVYDAEGYEWVVEGRQILTDLSAPLKVKFIFRNLDEAQFSPGFITALVNRLAADSCYALSSSGTMKDRLEKDFNQSVADAKGYDGQEGTPQAIDASYLLGDRDGY